MITVFQNTIYQITVLRNYNKNTRGKKFCKSSIPVFSFLKNSMKVYRSPRYSVYRYTILPVYCHSETMLYRNSEFTIHRNVRMPLILVNGIPEYWYSSNIFIGGMSCNNLLFEDYPVIISYLMIIL